MEEDSSMLCFSMEAAGESDSPDAPSSRSGSDQMQDSDLMLQPGLMAECQAERDHDEQAEATSSFDHSEEPYDQDTTPEPQQIELGNATTPRNPIPTTFAIDTAFEMDEDDYEALRLSIGVPRQSQTVIPSPATPGIQIAQESKVADRRLGSPIQFYPRHSPTSLSTSPTQAYDVSNKPSRRPRKRAYQLLEQETASFLGNWNKNKPSLHMNDVSNREKTPKLARKSSSNPKQTGTPSDIQSMTWNVASEARLEVVLQPKQKSWLAGYRDVDAISKTVTQQPRRGGHRGRGRLRALPTAPKKSTRRVRKGAAVVSKNASSGRPKNAVRRVIRSRVGVIGARRSQRTNVGKSGSTEKSTTSGGDKPIRKAKVESASRRGRPPGPSKRRGRPPSRGRPSTRGRVSNRRK